MPWKGAVPTPRNIGRCLVSTYAEAQAVMCINMTPQFIASMGMPKHIVNALQSGHMQRVSLQQSC